MALETPWDIASAAYGSIKNIAEGIIKKDLIQIGIGVLQAIGIALGAKGLEYLKSAQEMYDQVKLVPSAMRMGVICSAMRDEDLTVFLKVMSMLGVSAEVINKSIQEYKIYLQQKEE